VDGNKRLGWLATVVFLELVGIKAARASNNDVYELVIWIASPNPDLDNITTRLRNPRPSPSPYFRQLRTA
jgi:death-on-curing protein